MNRQLRLTCFICFALILNAPLGFAQDEEPEVVPEIVPEAEDTNVSAGQEVEVNEDVYRQFMELKDARGQRNMLPENAFKPGSGAQKLDKLPEESQKHLRNQLREIIVQGDQWQPGDETGDYPYVPSAAASTDASLQKQEAEAWGELVDNYHQREAEIYENSPRSQAAMANGSSPGGGPGNGEGSRSGSGGGGEGQESSQSSEGEQGGAAGSYSPNARNDPNATSTQGVSQNAMEFLSGKSGRVVQSGDTDGGSGESGQDDNQAGSQSGAQSGSQGQQGDESQAQADSSPAMSTSARVNTEELTETTADTSQNALEYLTGGQTQTSQADGNSPGDEGTDETMPLPELPSLRGPASDNIEGTLTIQDLINAQGVRNATGTGAPIPGANSGTAPVDDPTKEGDG